MHDEFHPVERAVLANDSFRLGDLPNSDDEGLSAGLVSFKTLNVSLVHNL